MNKIYKVSEKEQSNERFKYILIQYFNIDRTTL